MSNYNRERERAGKVSSLGVLLIVCMLLLAAFTLTVNLIFRDASAVPTMFGHRYHCYQGTDLQYLDVNQAVQTIPNGTLLILDKEEKAAPVMNDIVLYRSTTGGYSIGQVSLILNASATTDTAEKELLYYLTVADSTTAVAVSEGGIAGICRQQSAEMGTIITSLSGTAGVIICMILPCVVLLLYVAMLFVAAKEDDDDDDDDTDLAFVKALQEKKKALEQADHEGEPDSEETRSAKEREAAETEAAIRRAEKFAAIRKNIEGHRTSSRNTSEVPLYTTGHTTVPTTKQMPAPDPELLDLIAGRSAQKTQSLPKATPDSDSADALIAQLTAAKAEQETAAETAPKETAPKAEPQPAPKTVSTPAPKAAPKPEIAAPKQAASPAPKKAAPVKTAKPAAKPASTSGGANFNDLMAMLDAAQKKLDE